MFKNLRDRIANEQKTTPVKTPVKNNQQTPDLNISFEALIGKKSEITCSEGSGDKNVSTSSKTVLEQFNKSNEEIIGDIGNSFGTSLAEEKEKRRVLMMDLNRRLEDSEKLKKAHADERARLVSKLKQAKTIVEQLEKDKSTALAKLEESDLKVKLAEEETRQVGNELKQHRDKVLTLKNTTREQITSLEKHLQTAKHKHEVDETTIQNLASQNQRLNNEQEKLIQLHDCTLAELKKLQKEQKSMKNNPETCDTDAEIQTDTSAPVSDLEKQDYFKMCNEEKSALNFELLSLKQQLKELENNLLKDFEVERNNLQSKINSRETEVLENLEKSEKLLSKTREELQEKELRLVAVIEEKENLAVQLNERSREINDLVGNSEKHDLELQQTQLEMDKHITELSEIRKEFVQKRTEFETTVKDLYHKVEKLEKGKQQNEDVIKKLENISEKYANELKEKSNKMSDLEAALSNKSIDFDNLKKTFETKTKENADNLKLHDAELAKFKQACTKKFKDLKAKSNEEIGKKAAEIEKIQHENAELKSSLQTFTTTLEEEKNSNRILNEKFLESENHFKQEMEKKENLMERFKAKVLQLQNNLKVKQEELENLSKTTNDSDVHLNKLTSQLSEKSSLLDNFQAQVNELNNEKQTLKTQMEELKGKCKTVDELSEELKSKTTEIEKLIRENDEVKSSLANFTTSLEEEKHLNKTLNDKFLENENTFKQEVEQKGNLIEKFKAKVVQLQNNIKIKQEELENLSKTTNDSDTRLNNLVSQLSEKSILLDNVQAQVTELTNEKQSVHTQMEELEGKMKKFNELSQDVVDKTTETEKLICENAELKSSLQTSTTSLEAEKHSNQILNEKFLENENTLKQDLEQKGNLIENMKVKILQLEENMKAKQLEIDTLGQTSNDSDVNLSKLNTVLQEKLGLLNNLQVNISKLTDEKSSLQAKNQDFENKIEDLNKMLEEEKQSAQILNEKLLENEENFKQECIKNTIVLDEVKLKNSNLEGYRQDKQVEIDRLQECAYKNETQISALNSKLIEQNNLVELLKSNIEEINTENSSLKESLNAVSHTYEGEQKANVELQEQIRKNEESHLKDVESFKSTIKEFETKISQMEENMKSKQLEIDELGKSTNLSETYLNNLKLKLDEQNSLVENLQSNVQTLTSEKSVLENKKKELELEVNEIIQLKEKFINKEEEISKLNLANNEIKLSVETLTSTLEEEQKTNTTLNEKVDELLKSEKNYKEEIRNKAIVTEKFKAKILQLQKNIKKKQLEVDNLLKSTDQSGVELNEFNKKYEEQNHLVGSLQVIVSDLNNDKKSLEAELTALQEKLKESNKASISESDLRSAEIEKLSSENREIKTSMETLTLTSEGEKNMINTLKEKLKIVLKKEKNCKKVIETNEMTIKDLNSTVGQLKSEIKAKNKDYESKIEELNKLSDDVRNKSIEITNLNSENSEIRTSLATLTQALEEDKNSAKLLNEKLMDSEKSYKQERDEIQTVVEGLTSKLALLTDTLKVKQDELENLSKTTNDSDVHLNKLTSQLSDKSSQLDNFQAQVNELTNEKQTLQNSLQEMQIKLNEVEEMKLQDQRNHKDLLESQLSEHSSSLESLQADKKSLEDNLQEMHSKLQEVESKMKEDEKNFEVLMSEERERRNLAETNLAKEKLIFTNLEEENEKTLNKEKDLTARIVELESELSTAIIAHEKQNEQNHVEKESIVQELTVSKKRIEKVEKNREVLKNEIKQKMKLQEQEKQALQDEVDMLKQKLDVVTKSAVDDSQVETNKRLKELQESFDVRLLEKKSENEEKLKQLVKEYETQMMQLDEKSKKQILEMKEKSKEDEHQIRGQHHKEVVSLQTDILNWERTNDQLRDKYETELQFRENEMTEQVDKAMFRALSAEKKLQEAGWETTIGKLQAQINELSKRLSESQQYERQCAVHLEDAKLQLSINSSPLANPEKVEYLRKVLYKYMMGSEGSTMAKVLVTLLDFTPSDKQEIFNKHKILNCKYQ